MFGIRVLLAAACALALAQAPDPAGADRFLETEIVREGGDCGRLVVPDLGISVALYGISGEPPSYGQEVTDAPDSAAWCDNRLYYGHPCRAAVADHNYQGFEALMMAVPGRTRAYIAKDGKVEEYLCLSRFTGYNRSDYLEDASGEDVLDAEDGAVVLYTCKDGWEVLDMVCLARQGTVPADNFSP